MFITSNKLLKIAAETLLHNPFLYQIGSPWAKLKYNIKSQLYVYYFKSYCWSYPETLCKRTPTMSCICCAVSLAASSGAESLAAASSASGGSALLSAGWSMAATSPLASHVAAHPPNGLHACSKDCFLNGIRTDSEKWHLSRACSTKYDCLF